MALNEKTTSRRNTMKKRLKAMPKGGLPFGGSPKKREKRDFLRTLDKTILEPREVEILYPVTAGTLANLRTDKRGPRGPLFHRVGRKVIYKVEDIEAWLFSNPVQTADSHRDLR
jgi:hypothetical protein